MTGLSVISTESVTRQNGPVAVKTSAPVFEAVFENLNLEATKRVDW